MTRDEYIKAVNVIMVHDAMIKRVRDVSRDLSREVGDDFGGLAITPETGMRTAFINLIEKACGDVFSNTTYLFDEASHLVNGGSITTVNGTVYPITHAEDCWMAIEAFKKEQP